MIRMIGLALVLALATTLAYAEDDDDKVPDADIAKIKAALTELGCEDGEGFKKESEGIYEIDDAKCKMGIMDIKLDKDFKVILISRY
ncbi:MAG TPA: hypothetical protein VK451_00845 [Methyloceanibacter sp.]|nr:hypothetical protein [Methyloceanibacter sp.]